MKIDRQRFLLLVGSLAAGVSAFPACSSPPPASPSKDPPAGSAQAVELVVPPIASAAGSSEPAPEVPRLSGPAKPLTISGGNRGSLPDANGAPVTSRRPNPYDGTPVTAQDCNPLLNREGVAPACALSAPGPSCESFHDTQTECPTLKQLLKPRVAAAAIECLRRRSGTKEICEFNVSSICAYEALGSACLDPTARAACTSVLKRCGSGGKMSRESCEAGVSAIADAKRAKFLSCITESCRFETCLTYL